MANTVFLLLITISGVIGNDSYSSSSSLSFDQLITDLDTSLLDGYFQRNASSSRIPDFSDDFKFNDLTSNQTRSRRNADPLSDYSGKLSTVARISNGISLLAGLINKNIPIDTVIEELLHFGNVNLSSVLALQKDKMETALTDLQSAQTGMDTTGIVGSLEDNTIGMSRVREAFIESDFGNFKHPADYFTEAQQFKDDTTTDYSVVQSTTTAVKEALETIDKLENPPPITKKNYGTFVTSINVLHDSIASAESAPASFATIVQNLESLSKLNNSEAILKPVQQMLDLVALYPKLPHPKVEDVEDADNNVDKINSISSKFAKSASSNFLVLNDFVTSRLNPSPTKLQFTSGFPKGASDLKLLTKDIRDPSFEATMGTGKNFAKLSGGLKPLTDWSVKLEALESALKPIATSAILQSSANVAELQTLVSGLSVTSKAVVSVAQLMIDNKPVAVNDQKVTPVVNLMGNAVKISEELARIKSSASAFPQPPQDVKDVKEILAKLPTVNGPEHVQEVIDELKKVPEKLKKVAEYLNELQEFLKNVPDPTVTRQTADLVFQADGELQSFKTEIDKYVIPKLVTIRDSKEPIDSVVRALKASKIIKDFKPDDITNIRSAVDTISQALPSIKELQKPPTSRKKRQTNNVKELVKLKDAQKTSGALGSAAASINSMSQLKGMETTVVQDLKTKSTNFTTEVAKVTDVSKKSEILKKWGDHKAFISSLDSTLGQIKDFGAKLSVDKDLRKLGAQLEASKTVSDVKQSISDKSEAVGLLILETSDAKAKTELEALKTQLDSLAALDLQFSNHHSAFPAVPAALKSFFDFLTKFVTPEDTSAAVAAAASAAAAAAAANATDTGIYIGSGVGGAVVLALAAILAWYLYKRHTRDKIKGWPAMKVWIMKNYFKNLTHAIGLARSLMNEMDKEVIEPKKKTKDLMRMRYPEMEVFMDTAVCLPDGRFINANWIKTMGEARFIATQGPLEEERAKDKEKTLLKYDTRGDFLYMIIVHQTEFVVQLCKWVEEQEDADKRKERRAREIKEEQDIFDGPADKKEEGLLKLAEKMKRAYDARMKDKAAKYYEEKVGDSMQIGVYTVTTDSLEETDYGDLEIRKLTIKDKEGKPLHSFTHIFHNQWPDHGIPNREKPVIDALLMVTQSKKPIVVHCSAGVGRTMSFIGGEVLARDAERHPKKRTSEMFIPLRQSRYRGMQTAAQCYLSMVLSIGLLIERHGKSDPESKDIWKKHLDHYTFVREKMADEDLGEKRRQEKEDFYENLAKKRAKRDEEKVKRHLADLKAGAKKKESRLDSQADSVQIENETTPEAKERTGKETPMTTPTTVTPKQRAAGGGEHVAIDMESEE